METKKRGRKSAFFAKKDLTNEKDVFIMRTSLETNDVSNRAKEQGAEK